MKFPKLPFFGKRSAAVADEILTRSSGFERAAVDEENRTISAILSTEQPVPMFDYRSGKMVDEILRADGGSMPSQLVLLDNHSRFGSNSVLGSVRNLQMDGDKWRGQLHFAKSKNPNSEREDIWELVRAGHLTDGSIGYRYDEDSYVDIAPGQTAEVKGKTYKAGKRTLRVVTAWQAKEYSTTPIGADSDAKLGRNQKLVSQQDDLADSTSTQDLVRSTNTTEKNQMNEELRKFLESLGLRSDATDDQAKGFMACLSDANRQRAERIESGAEKFTPETPGQRSEPTQTQSAQTQSAESVVAAMRAETARVDYIRGFADQVPSETIQRAISEGWDEARANREFLTLFRSRSKGVSGHVGIHDATASRSVTRQGLQAALIMRSGYELDSALYDTNPVAHALRQQDANASWLIEARAAHRSGGRLTDEASRAMEVGHKFRRASTVDLVRAMLQVDQVRFDPYDNQDIWRRSLTSSAVQEIFTTNFSVQMLAGFMGKPDTTVGWCREADVPNFQTTERKQMGKGAKMTRRERGQTADHGQIDAIGESYRVYEFAQQFFIDYQDFVDDRLGALDVTPEEMGEAAAEVRPDMVYYLLMSNPTMARDSTAVFATAHGNLSTSTALSLDALASLKTKMRTQTNNGRHINVQPAAIIVPEVKEVLALEMVGSSEKRDTTSSTKYGTSNWARGRFNVVCDPRLDVGVTDPVSGTVQAAKTGSFYMVAEDGRYGVEVGYLAGTGRRPTQRSFVATEGRFGRGWDIQFVIGAKIIGYEGLQEARA